MYVPAFPILYGSMDRLLEHYRRYTKRGLASLLVANGFRVVENRYCNFIGFWAWFVNNRLLKVTSQKPVQVRLFDRFVLPLQVRLERLREPWLGQNLFVAAQRV